MLHLRVYGSSSQLAEVGVALEASGAARHAALSPGVVSGRALLTAEVDGESADVTLQYLLAQGLVADDIAIARFDDVGPTSAGRRGAALIWSDVMGQARQNSRPVGRYFVFMLAAGVIAGFGVIEDNQILIVGAMAVSPDTLPVTAVCIAAVTRRWRLAGAALVTLAVGLGAACVVAGLVGAALDLFGGLPADFQVGDTALKGLSTTNTATICVALAAGIAGMLALETRASSAVGVAISVTTIPAAAYLGVAAGVGESTKAVGALGVLGVNVAMLLVGGVTTLLVQRHLGSQPA